MDLSRVLEMACQSDVGRVRSHNEDSLSCDPASGLVVLADGMGGYNAGEVASGIAVTLISSGIKEMLGQVDPERIDPKTGKCFALSMLHEQVAAANLAIYHSANGNPGYAGMGTTLVAALFYDDRVSVAHLGDSRMYRFRDGILERLTHDHSLLQQQLDSGLVTPEEARHSQHRNIVTRALGVEREAEAEIGSYETRPEDIYLLCSDGLNDMLEDEEIRLIVDTMKSNLKLAVGQLIELANENGGRDNISVILVKVRQNFAVRQGLFARFMSSFRK